jgi:hypothetical protein
MSWYERRFWKMWIRYPRQMWRVRRHPVPGPECHP